MFELPKLNYHYNDLEPFIDAQTVETHYAKHHQGYCTNLNKALEGYSALQTKSVEDLLSNVNTLPEAIRQTVVNNGGGYYNHNLYWENLVPAGGELPQKTLLTSLEKTFGSYEKFKQYFTDSALKLFGSGWVWLVKNAQGELSIVSTANQNSPISSGLAPILALDVWEHAYYLKYQNRRAEYVQNWWQIINWSVITTRLDSPLP